jgi:hypothetical protein
VTSLRTARPNNLSSIISGLCDFLFFFFYGTQPASNPVDNPAVGSRAGNARGVKSTNRFHFLLEAKIYWSYRLQEALKPQLPLMDSQAGWMLLCPRYEHAIFWTRRKSCTHGRILVLIGVNIVQGTLTDCKTKSLLFTAQDDHIQPIIQGSV